MEKFKPGRGRLHEPTTEDAEAREALARLLHEAMGAVREAEGIDVEARP